MIDEILMFLVPSFRGPPARFCLFHTKKNLKITIYFLKNYGAE